MTCGAVAREISPKRECPAKSPSKSPGTFPTRCGNAITSSSLRIRSRTSPERTGRPGFLRHLPGPEQTEASAMPRYDRFRPVPGELVRYQGRSEERRVGKECRRRRGRGPAREERVEEQRGVSQ